MIRAVLRGDVHKQAVSLLTELLSKGLADYVLAYRTRGEGVEACIYRKGDVLDLNVFTPTIPGLPIPTILSWSSTSGLKGVVAAIVKPCMARAIVELAKLQQIDRDKLIIVSVDCIGTIDVENYKDLLEEGFTQTGITEECLNGRLEMREACGLCTDPVPPVFDLHLSPYKGGLYAYAGSKLGNKILEVLKAPREEGDPYVKFKNLISRRQEEKQRYVEEAKFKGFDELQKFFEDCIGCHNCMEVCPLCFCKECFYDSPRYDYVTRRFLSWSPQDGMTPLLQSKLQFHVGRAVHMSTSCVECGLCEQACPKDINLTRLFLLLAEANQELFSYRAGRSVEEEPPLRTFHAEGLSSFEGG